MEIVISILQKQKQKTNLFSQQNFACKLFRAIISKGFSHLNETSRGKGSEMFEKPEYKIPAAYETLIRASIQKTRNKWQQLRGNILRCVRLYPCTPSPPPQADIIQTSIIGRQLDLFFVVPLTWRSKLPIYYLKEILTNWEFVMSRSSQEVDF